MQLAESLVWLLSEIDLDLIAEEFETGILAKLSCESIAKRLADNGQIEHRFCDPDSEQRQMIGYRDYVSIFHDLLNHNEDNLQDNELLVKARAIEVGRFFPVREEYWLQQIGDLIDGAVAFVCGDAHIDGFESLLRSKGILSRVVERGIGVDPNETSHLQALNYLEQYPELASWQEIRLDDISYED